MPLFANREQAFEEMFAHDQEARFRALARRNRLLGQWAAEQLGLTGEQVAAYVDEISRSLVADVVDEHLVLRVHADFAKHGTRLSAEDIRGKMHELMDVAIAQVRSSSW